MAARCPRRGSERAGLLGGIGAEQVVEGVPAGNVLGDQAGTGELPEQSARLGGVQARPGWRRPAR